MTTDVTEPQASPAAATPPRKNVFARIAGVLFAPAETFEEIARSPRVIAPLLIVLAISFTSTMLIMPRLDFESIYAKQAEQLRKQNSKMTDADVERMQRMTAAVTKVGMWLSPLMMVAIFAILAGVLLVAFRLMEGEGTYVQAFAATIYAYVPMLILSIISMIVVLARGSFDPVMAATLVKSNPSFLVDLTEQPVLFSVFSSLDLFSIWSVVLFIFGFSALSKLSMGRSAGIVITLWAAMVMVKVGFVALTSG